MKIMKRVLCISIAILILFTSLSACVPRQQEEPSELDLLKAEWQRYVVDRTEEVGGVAVGRMSISSGLASTHEESVVNGVLDICKTLNVADLTPVEDPALLSNWPDLTVCLPIVVTPNYRFIQISLYKNGEAYVCLVQEEEDKDDTIYWAYIDNWLVYEQLLEYSDY